MRIEEIRKILNNTKVYVDGKSREIQEKLFTFGYEWDDCNPTKVNYEGSPFLFINDEGEITYSNGMLYFKRSKNREISADEILSLEITEPSYRPFESQEECFEEMKKHIPFGWFRHKKKGHYEPIRIDISKDTPFECLFNEYNFADGTPFGIKED